MMGSPGFEDSFWPKEANIWPASCQQLESIINAAQGKSYSMNNESQPEPGDRSPDAPPESLDAADNADELTAQYGSSSVEADSLIVAEAVEDHAADEPITATAEVIAKPAAVAIQEPAPLPPELQNLAANGGAVGAVVLGVWSILGSLLTPYSLINGLLGLLMGLWGLSSRRRLLAVVGIVISFIGMTMSLLEVGQLIETYLWVDTETA